MEIVFKKLLMVMQVVFVVILQCLFVNSFLVGAQTSLITRGLYVGFMHHYNIGDDAMFEVAQELFATVGQKFGRMVVLVPFLPPADCHLFKIDFLAVHV